MPMLTIRSVGFASGPLVTGPVIAAMGYAGLMAVCVAIRAAACERAMVVSRRLRDIACASFDLPAE
jgi:hypothetical protein